MSDDESDVEAHMLPSDDPNDSSKEHGSVIGMTFNTITNVIGGGVLDIPHAMEQASMAIGAFLCVFSSICSTFSVYILVRMCDHTQRFSMQEIWSFGLCPQAPLTDIANAVKRRDSGKLAPGELEEVTSFLATEQQNAHRRDILTTFMTITIFLYNFGCLVLYGVVIGDSLPPVVQHFFKGSGIWIEKGTWLLAGGVVFFVLSCARRMDELKWSSALGFATILYVVVVVVVKYFLSSNDPSDVVYFKFSNGISNAMTTLGLAYCYHYNVPYYYKELKNRTTKKMLYTAALSQPVTFVCYLATGVFGYLMFGSDVASKHSGGNIVKNFDATDTVVNIGRFGLFFHFCCVYPILAVSCRRGLHRTLKRYVFSKGSSQTTSAVNGVKGSQVDISLYGGGAEPDEDPAMPIIVAEAFGIVSASIFFAWITPGINIVINITGSLFGMFLMFIAPGILGVRMFSVLKQQDPSETKYFYMSVFLVFIGVFFLVSSFVGIVMNMANGKS